MRTLHPSLLTVAAGLLVVTFARPVPAQSAQNAQNAPDAPKRPACADHTGIRWQLPFATAKARSVAEQRILLVKSIAFGTTPDGGW